MKSSSAKINNLTALTIEKNRLSTYCNYQEQLIGLKLDYLRENYPKVLGESLLPYDTAQNVKVSSLLDTVNDLIAKLLPGIFETSYLPKLMLKLVQVVVINLVHKKGNG